MVQELEPSVVSDDLEAPHSFVQCAFLLSQQEGEGPVAVIDVAKRLLTCKTPVRRSC